MLTDVRVSSGRDDSAVRRSGLRSRRIERRWRSGVATATRLAGPSPNTVSVWRLPPWHRSTATQSARERRAQPTGLRWTKLAQRGDSPLRGEVEAALERLSAVHDQNDVPSDQWRSRSEGECAR